MDQNRILFDLPADTYHADPCDAPSLSASIADLMLRKTATHAWQSHPRLNARYTPTHKPEFDMGTAVHTMLLGGNQIAIIEANDYRTKAAKELRDEAREAGHTPLLAHQHEQVERIATTALKQIEAHPDVSLTGGNPEVTMIWFDFVHQCWCRSRPDYLLRNGDILDVKLTGTTPHGWEKHAFNMGYDTRVGHYLSGVKYCMPDAHDTQYLFLNVEKDPPHNLFVTAFDPEAIAMAQAKANEATRRWAQCLRENEWPGWHQEVYHYAPPPWILAEWELYK